MHCGSSGNVGRQLRMVLIIFGKPWIYIYIFDKNFNNCYFIKLEITLIHTVDIEDNKYYLNNIMDKVIPKSKSKLYICDAM